MESNGGTVVRRFQDSWADLEVNSFVDVGDNNLYSSNRPLVAYNEIFNVMIVHPVYIMARRKILKQELIDNSAHSTCMCMHAKCNLYTIAVYIHACYYMHACT